MSAMISLDNGMTFLGAQEAVEAIEAHPCITWDDVVIYMDDELREQVHGACPLLRGRFFGQVS